MLEEVRDQAEAGGVAEAEEAAPTRLERNRGISAAGPSTVLHGVVAQFAEQPGGQKLGPVGDTQGMGVRVAEEGTHAELSVPVERRAAHDVPGVSNPV